MIEKFNHVRSKAIRNAAKDEDCTVCGTNDGTTVFAHFDSLFAGKGMGQKADDLGGFFACYLCHENYGHKQVYDWVVLRAYYRTIRRLWDRGIIGELKGG